MQDINRSKSNKGKQKGFQAELSRDIAHYNCLFIAIVDHEDAYEKVIAHTYTFFLRIFL